MRKEEGSKNRMKIRVCTHKKNENGEFDNEDQIDKRCKILYQYSPPFINAWHFLNIRLRLSNKYFSEKIHCEFNYVVIFEK